MDSHYKEKLNLVKDFLKTNNAKLIAHYYVDAELQKLAEDTGCLLYTSDAADE